MNKVLVIGRVVAAPEAKTTQNGKLVASYRIAVERFGKDAGADFFPCIAWEKNAEFAEKYLRKGTKILIEGRLQSRQYEKDGQKRTITEIIVNSVEFCESKKQESGNEFGTPVEQGEIPF